MPGTWPPPPNDATVWRRVRLADERVVQVRVVRLFGVPVEVSAMGSVLCPGCRNLLDAAELQRPGAGHIVTPAHLRRPSSAVFSTDGIGLPSPDSNRTEIPRW